jgi:hypothetical protein
MGTQVKDTFSLPQIYINLRQWTWTGRSSFVYVDTGHAAALDKCQDMWQCEKVHSYIEATHIRTLRL